MSSTPLQQLPPDVNRSIQFVAVQWTGVALSTTCLLLRLFSRTIITKSFGADDAILIFTTTISIVAAAICQTQMVPAGLGRHAVYVGTVGVETNVKWVTITAYLSVWCVVFTKFAVVILLCKIMGPTKAKKRFLWGLIGLLTAITITNVVLDSVGCIPLEKTWNPQVPGTCRLIGPRVYFGLLTAAFSALTDLILALTPITIVWNLQMKLQRKIAICIITGLGMIATIASAMKASKIALLGGSGDYTWNIVDLMIWTSVEASLIITCACLPALPALWKVIRDKEYRMSVFSSYQQRRQLQKISGPVELKPSAKTPSAGSSREFNDGLLPGKMMGTAETSTWSAV